MFRALLKLATRRKSLVAWASIVITGLNVVFMLSFTLILAVALDAAQFGTITAIYALGTIASTVFGLGVPLLVQRTIPAYRAQAKWPHYAAIVLIMTRFQYVLMGLVALTCFLYWIAPPAHDDIGLVAIVVFLAASISWGNISVSDIRTHGHNLKGTAIEKLLKPVLLVCAAIYVAAVAHEPNLVAIGAIMTATLAGSALAYGVARSIRRPHEAAALSQLDWSERKQWTEVCVSGMVVAFLFLGINRMDVVVLGSIAPASILGEYAIAQRAAEIISLPAMALSTFITPVLSANWAIGNKAKIQEIVGLCVAVSSACGALAAVCLWWISAPLFAYLGDTYAGGEVLMPFIAVGQLALAAAGPAGAVLVMTGHHRQYVLITAGALALKVAAVYAGWWLAGAAGAAIASGLTIMCLVVTQGAIAYRLTGLQFGPYSAAREILSRIRSGRVER